MASGAARRSVSQGVVAPAMPVAPSAGVFPPVLPVSSPAGALPPVQYQQPQGVVGSGGVPIMQPPAPAPAPVQLAVPVQPGAGAAPVSVPAQASPVAAPVQFAVPGASQAAVAEPARNGVVLGVPLGTAPVIPQTSAVLPESVGVAPVQAGNMIPGQQEITMEEMAQLLS